MPKNTTPNVLISAYGIFSRGGIEILVNKAYCRATAVVTAGQMAALAESGNFTHYIVQVDKRDSRNLEHIKKVYDSLKPSIERQEVKFLAWSFYEDEEHAAEDAGIPCKSLGDLTKEYFQVFLDHRPTLADRARRAGESIAYCLRHGTLPYYGN